MYIASRHVLLCLSKHRASAYVNDKYISFHMVD